VVITVGVLAAKWARNFFKKRRRRLRLDEAILGRPAEPGFDEEPGLLKDHRQLKEKLGLVQTDVGHIKETLDMVLLGPDGLSTKVSRLRVDVDGLIEGDHRV
jgi:hypothetical protein